MKMLRIELHTTCGIMRFFRDDKKTIKCRVVFDASMRGNGVFLNDCVLPRPDLQPNLASLLINCKQNWSHSTYLKDIPSSQAIARGLGRSPVPVERFEV